MNFSQVDPILIPWARAKSIPLSSRYRGSDVRSFELVGRGGRVQVWIEVNDQISVYAWDFRKRKARFIADVSDLEASLNKAEQLARAWCE